MARTPAPQGVFPSFGFKQFGLKLGGQACSNPGVVMTGISHERRVIMRVYNAWKNIAGNGFPKRSQIEPRLSERIGRIA